VEAHNEWLNLPIPSFVLCIMWVTFRRCWVPAAMPRVVAHELYFWHAVVVSSVYQSREQCVVAYYRHVGFGQSCRCRVCGKDYHGIKAFLACPERSYIFSQSCSQAHTQHVNNRNIIVTRQRVEDMQSFVAVSVYVETEAFVEGAVYCLGKMSV